MQMVSEKVGGAEGTKLDEEFKDMERVSRTYKHILFAEAFDMNVRSVTWSHRRALPVCGIGCPSGDQCASHLAQLFVSVLEMFISAQACTGNKLRRVYISVFPLGSGSLLNLLPNSIKVLSIDSPAFWFLSPH